MPCGRAAARLPLGDLDFRAGRKQGDIARRLRFMQHIGAPRRQVLGRPGLAQHRQALTRQRQHARRRPVPERQFPAFRRLDDIGGPVDVDVRRRPQHRQMLDRLVRRSVLAEPDGIMRQHVDHALLHQRRQPHAAARIIGKHQEGAAIGNEAAMQRQPVHHRRHGVFADAVMDVPALEPFPGGCSRSGGLRQVGTGQVGRSADRQRGRTIDHLERHLRGLRVATLVAFCLMLLAEGRQLAEHVAGRAPDNAVKGFRRCAAAACRSCHCLRAVLAAFGHRLPGGFDVGGNGERLIGPAERFAGRLRFRPCPAVRRGSCATLASFGAPLPIVVRQAISEGLELLRAFSMAAATASGSWPSTAEHPSRPP
jgi:hypothetical protein